MPYSTRGSLSKLKLRKKNANRVIYSEVKEVRNTSMLDSPDLMKYDPNNTTQSYSTPKKLFSDTSDISDFSGDTDDEKKSTSTKTRLLSRKRNLTGLSTKKVTKKSARRRQNSFNASSSASSVIASTQSQLNNRRNINFQDISENCQNTMPQKLDFFSNDDVNTQYLIDAENKVSFYSSTNDDVNTQYLIDAENNVNDDIYKLNSPLYSTIKEDKNLQNINEMKHINNSKSKDLKLKIKENSDNEIKEQKSNTSTENSIDGDCPINSVDDECPINSVDDKCPINSVDGDCPINSVDDECPICRDLQVLGCYLEPCGCSKVCETCARKLVICPYCRTHIKKISKKCKLLENDSEIYKMNELKKQKVEYLNEKDKKDNIYNISPKLNRRQQPILNFLKSNLIKNDEKQKSVRLKINSTDFKSEKKKQKNSQNSTLSSEENYMFNDVNSNVDESKQWACPRCTYFNHYSSSHCEMCNEENKNKKKKGSKISSHI